jgi:hypothetical protein
MPVYAHAATGVSDFGNLAPKRHTTIPYGMRLVGWKAGLMGEAKGESEMDSAGKWDGMGKVRLRGQARGKALSVAVGY